MTLPNEKNKWLYRTGLLLVAVTLIATIVLAAIGVSHIFAPVGNYTFSMRETFYRTTTAEEEDYSEDETRCFVEYQNESGSRTCVVEYTYEQWADLQASDVEIQAYVYINEQDADDYLAFAHEATEADIRSAVQDQNADKASSLFGVTIAIGLFCIGLAIIVFFGKHFTTYEKTWFLSILVLASVFSLLFPEESCNGINGIWIMALYLLDTLLNILCELLISKQSKWNFIVSVFVEITEILICVVLAYRFATMATTLLFWLPCDIISFVNWNKKKDAEREELTKVRTLKGWQELVLVGGIVVWTVGIGYLLTTLDLGADFFGGNELLMTIVCYLDACASAVGIVNGLAILFRFREQWIAWYISTVLEAAINIISGQYVLLILKFGYLTNTTYGYIKWTKYIKSHPEVAEEKSFF